MMSVRQNALSSLCRRGHFVSVRGQIGADYYPSSVCGSRLRRLSAKRFHVLSEGVYPEAIINKKRP